MFALSNENIGGLDVSVDNAFRMGGVEAVGDFDGVDQEALYVHGFSGDEVLERLAIEKFHGDVAPTVMLANFVDSADVGVIERGGGAGFTTEAFEGLRVAIEIFREEFKGDKAAEFGVFGLVHNAHTPTAEFFQDAVVRKCLADERGGIRHRMPILDLNETASQQNRQKMSPQNENVRFVQSRNVRFH